MSLRIHTYPNNYRVWRAQIAAKINGVQIEEVECKIGTDNKTPEFLKLNPNGKVPTLETPFGGIFESNAILRYVAGLRTDTGLFGNGSFEAAQVNMWLDWINTEFEPHRSAWVYPVIGIFPFKQGVYMDAKRDLTKAMGILEGHFTANTFFVGHTITAADISLACSLVFCYANLFDADYQAKFPAVKRWFNTIVNHPAAKATIPAFTFATTETLAKGQTAAGEKKPPAPKGQQQGGNAALKAPAPAKVAPTPEELEVKVEKKVDPLDLLPPPKVKMDDLKRAFCAKRPVDAGYFPTFWADVIANPDDYSVYHLPYKYNEDFEVVFRTANGLAGFFNRCEIIRKHCFGAGIVTTDGQPDHDIKVNCALIIRGATLPDAIKDISDHDEYDWIKVDPTKDEDKKLIEEIFYGEKLQGRPVEDRKLCK